MMLPCFQCQNNFDITAAEQEFLQKISPVFNGKKYLIPDPTLCPDCRLQRRVAWRNERSYYHRSCGLCGKSIVSLFSPDKPNPVYCNLCWWGDKWDSKTFGKSYDPNRPFFDQVQELMNVVPELTIQNDDGIGSVNSAYCQDLALCKNCYFVIGTWHTEDSYYSSMNVSYDRFVCDSGNLVYSELCYECLDSQKLYHCAFVQNSENCSDCFFGFDLKGCRNCFGCIGLRQKEFHIFNQPFSKEAYEKEKARWDLGSYAVLEQLKAQYRQWILQFPRKNMNLQNCKNTIGNNNFNCKNCFGFGLLSSEGGRYCHQCDGPKFCSDIFNSGNPQWCYEGMVPDNSYLTHFTWFSWRDKHVLYSLNCHDSENLFACVALRRQKYCILNKQYSKEEYENLVPKIIARMQIDNEWGEFFPISMSYFCYNETVAQELFPLTEEAATEKGFPWKERDPKEYGPQTCIIPDHIRDAGDTLPREILACIQCRKNFKIIREELAFYRKMTLPIPRKCSDCRHCDRLALRTPYKLFSRFCVKCKKPIQTSYSKERPEIVYCEECYLKTVY